MAVFISRSREATEAFAAEYAKTLSPGDTVLLAGMGAEALPGMGAVSITERSQFMFRGINRGIFLRFGQ